MAGQMNDSLAKLAHDPALRAEALRLHAAGDVAGVIRLAGQHGSTLDVEAATRAVQGASASAAGP